MQQFVNANQPVSYVGAIHTSAIERPIPLRFGEGVNGYILEGVTDMNFILAQGRRGNKHWMQTSRVSFKYAPGVRMTKDNSSNLVPTNQKVGFVFDKVLWDNFTKITLTEGRGKTKDQEQRSFYSFRKPFHAVSFSFIAMHYSNGQPISSYASIQDSLAGRNNYIQGDFSTNVLQPSFTYNYFSPGGTLVSTNLGYQRDGNWFGPFSFLDAQKQRYGQDRLVGFTQLLTHAFKNPFGREIRVIGKDHNTYWISPMWEYRLRLEYEYILGNLNQFNRTKDYRFNVHLYAEGRPLRSRALGYVLHVYRGRDYFNIRYDDIVWVVEGGLSFVINRYQNPYFHQDQAIIKRSEELPEFYQKQEMKNKTKH